MPPQEEAHSSGASERPIGEGCWSYGSTDHTKKNKCSTRDAKVTDDGRGGAGDRGQSGGRAPSRSSRPTTSSGGVMRPGTGTQEPAVRTRSQQKQLQSPAFNTRSRNDTR